MNKKRILICHFEELNEILYALPSLFMLKKIKADYEVAVFCKEKLYDFMKCISYIDRIMKMESYTKQNLIDKIEFFNAEYFLSFKNNDYIVKLAKASRSKKRLAPRQSFSDIMTFNKGVFQNRQSGDKQEIEYNLDIVKNVDANKFRVLYEFNNKINIPEKNLQLIHSYLEKNNLNPQSIVSFSPFAEDELRNLSLDSYHKMIENFIAKYRVNVILLCSEKEEQKAFDFVENISEDLRDKIHIFSNDNILNLSALLSVSPLHIGACSSLTLLANTFTKNIVGIYDTYNIKRYGLIGTNNVSYIEINEKNRTKDISEDLIEIIEQIL